MLLVSHSKSVSKLSYPYKLKINIALKVIEKLAEAAIPHRNKVTAGEETYDGPGLADSTAGVDMQRLLTGFIIVVGLLGLSERSGEPDAIQASIAEGDSSFDSPVISAVLYSDVNPDGRSLDFGQVGKRSGQATAASTPGSRTTPEVRPFAIGALAGWYWCGDQGADRRRSGLHLRLKNTQESVMVWE
jgi:hypothetical protein